MEREKRKKEGRRGKEDEEGEEGERRAVCVDKKGMQMSNESRRGV
jgi:hypothetical protein